MLSTDKAHGGGYVLMVRIECWGAGIKLLYGPFALIGYWGMCTPMEDLTHRV